LVTQANMRAGSIYTLFSIFTHGNLYMNITDNDWFNGVAILDTLSRNNLILRNDGYMFIVSTISTIFQSTIFQLFSTINSCLFFFFLENMHIYFVILENVYLYFST
jgi:hypothetical protein